MVILLSSAVSSFFQLLGVLLVFVFVLVITYFTTKWVGNYQKGSNQNKNLQIIEMVRMGSNKFIALVKAGEIYLVVAVGKEEVSLLAELTKEQLTELPDITSDQISMFSTDKNAVQENFQEVLKKVKEHFSKK